MSASPQHIGLIQPDNPSARLLPTVSRLRSASRQSKNAKPAVNEEEREKRKVHHQAEMKYRDRLAKAFERLYNILSDGMDSPEEDAKTVTRLKILDMATSEISSLRGRLTCYECDDKALKRLGIVRTDGDAVYYA